MLNKREKRIWRHKRVRAKIKGTSDKPRLCVFRSAKHIYAQLIDDENGKTIASANDLEIKNIRFMQEKKKTAVPKREPSASKSRKTEVAREVGKLIAEKAMQKKIKKVVFDRGGLIFHGRVKALAEGAREGGLQF